MKSKAKKKNRRFSTLQANIIAYLDWLGERRVHTFRQPAFDSKRFDTELKDLKTRGYIWIRDDWVGLTVKGEKQVKSPQILRAGISLREAALNWTPRENDNVAGLTPERKAEISREIESLKKLLQPESAKRVTPNKVAAVKVAATPKKQRRGILARLFRRG